MVGYHPQGELSPKKEARRSGLKGLRGHGVQESGAKSPRLSDEQQKRRPRKQVHRASPVNRVSGIVLDCAPRKEPPAFASGSKGVLMCSETLSRRVTPVNCLLASADRQQYELDGSAIAPAARHG